MANVVKIAYCAARDVHPNYDGPCDGVLWSNNRMTGGCDDPCSFIMRKCGSASPDFLDDTQILAEIKLLLLRSSRGEARRKHVVKRRATVKQTGFLRYLVPFVAYMILCCLAIGFCRCTGALAMWIGMRTRRVLPPEFSHDAFCATLRWQHWTPRWVDEARRLEAEGRDQ